MNMRLTFCALRALILVVVLTGQRIPLFCAEQVSCPIFYVSNQERIDSLTTVLYLRVEHGEGWEESASKSASMGADLLTQAFPTSISSLADATPLFAQYSGVFFLSGISVPNEYNVTVDWGDATPYGIHFVLNGTDNFVSGSSASQTYDMGSDFITGISLNTNTIEIYAESEEGDTSPKWTSHPVILPIPSWSTSLGAFGFTASLYELDAEFPVPHFEAETNSTLPSWLPIVGGHKLGVSESYASMKLKFNLNGTGEITLSGQTGFTAAGQSVGGQLDGTGSFGYSSSEGLAWSEASFHLGIQGDFNTPRVGLLTAIPCLAPLANIPGLSKINDWVSVWGNISPQIDLNATLINSGGKIAFDHGEAAGRLGLIINAQGGTESTNVKVYGGGNIAVTLQVPEPYLKNIVVGIVVGAEATVWGISVWLPFLPHEFEKTWTLYGGGSGSPPFQLTSMEVAKSLILEPMDRSYLGDADYNRFLPKPARQKTLLLTVPANADDKLVENVFPCGEPAIAAFDNCRMLLWICDDPTDPDFQNTEIQYSYFDGEQWSEPALIADDTRFEKAPQVQFDASGKAVCVWERIKDTDFTGTELEEMFPLSEIVYSVYDPSASAWSPVTVMTDNTIFDHSPLLKRAPSGDLDLVWEQNAANLLVGDDSDLPASASVLWFSMWGEGAWSTPTQVPGDLTGVPSWTMDCKDDEITIAYMQDLDGDLSTPTDSEVFLLSYDGSSWSPRLRLTNDSLPDVMPDIIYDGSGGWLLLWTRDGFLVAQRESESTPSTMAGTETAGFVPREVVLNSDGDVTLFWLEQRDEYPDIYYVARDGSSGTWSPVRRLTQNDSLEGCFKPVVAGNDILAVYMSRETLYKTRQIEVDEQQITIENIPYPGQTDLHLITHHLSADLAIAAEDMSVTGNVVPDGSVTLEVTVHNVGDISARNVPVAFYVNDPAKEENLIDSIQTIPGPINAGASETAQVAWTLPNVQSSQIIYAVVDPGLSLEEASRANNTASISVLHPELVLRQPEIWMGLNGDIAIASPISNTGQIRSPGFTVLGMDLLDNEKVVASVATGSIASGDEREVVLRIADWTMAVGSQLKMYRIVADPAHVVNEIATENNVGFVAIIIADMDSDGVPEFWELDHGTSDNNPLDAAFDPDDDDLTNLQEFANRTDPHKRDTDADGMPDGWEVSVGLNPTFDDADGDDDGDGLTNLQEMGYGTHPLKEDTDGDGVADATELLHGTVPTDPGSVFKIVAISFDLEGKPVLSWRSIAGKKHNIFASSNLSTGWGPAKASVMATPSGVNVWTDEEGQGLKSRFYRLDISDAP